jgi:hypothetical protein
MSNPSTPTPGVSHRVQALALRGWLWFAADRGDIPVLEEVERHILSTTWPPAERELLVEALDQAERPVAAHLLRTHVLPGTWEADAAPAFSRDTYSRSN